VETPLILKAKELLSGVNETANVVAKIPLLSIHVARDFEPISRTAWTECERRRVRRENISDIEGSCEREKRIVGAMSELAPENERQQKSGIRSRKGGVRRVGRRKREDVFGSE